MNIILGTLGQVGFQGGAGSVPPTPLGGNLSTDPDAVVELLVNTNQQSEAAVLAAASAEHGGNRPFTANEMAALQSLMGSIAGG